MNDYGKKVIASYSKIPPSEKFRKKCQECERDYSTLPELFEFFDGRKVETVEDFEERKREIKKYYEDNVYTAVPAENFDVSYVLREKGDYLNGIREQVDIAVKNDFGKCTAHLLIYRPKCDTPVPCVMAQNFGGNYEITPDEAVFVNEELSPKVIKKKRGKNKQFDIEKILNAGVALITCHYKDFAEDDKEKYRDKLGKLFPDAKELSAISHWSLGNKIMTTYALSRPEFSSDKIALFGHSRIGKTALWSAVNDERVSLAILNDSGCMGANLCRGSTGETLELITKTFPHWFCKNITQFVGNIDSLKVDQHMLLASIAPRKLYVANGKNDLCADPQGSFNSLQFALKAFKLYGLDTIKQSDTQPHVDTYEHSPSVGYHIRNGSHDVMPIDWDFYLKFIKNSL